MTQSLLAWIAAAVLLFWVVGAYNRLVRLRAEVKTAFATVDAELLPLSQLALSLESEEGARARLLLEPIQGASAQLAACLSGARNRPLEGDRIAALAAASEVWDIAWDRAEREDAHDLAGPLLPATLIALRARRVQQAQAAAARFNEAIDRYNEAVSQFPALLLAWVFGFKPGRPL